ncbi:hypothetical protein AF335_05030 [Streptomyces eurocidicus]|uniref:Uncharacterized protein n=1 Tax=Streptomyces eurocidicus TaxID=66423 RepID=A0A2N8NZ44_STREU|nr:hypothetical protein [Streptomyces eurocidicus]MBB5122739.1 hypothetical protein [Streptomyces eurocidicus]MBF6055214.1 hypothetical protein [Streptomyces eurocidicus]PNE34045.1 hypothetical protein AF335_05030 [Streptomyces eurocidicus]
MVGTTRCPDRGGERTRLGHPARTPRTERQLYLLPAHRYTTGPSPSAVPGGTWRSPDELRRPGRAMVPAELADIAEGYWDGWLPDGHHTTDWY